MLLSRMAQFILEKFKLLNGLRVISAALIQQTQLPFEFLDALLQNRTREVRIGNSN